MESDRKAAEALIDVLGNYVLGDRDKRRVLAVKLLGRIIEDKALEYLHRRYKLSGYQQVETILETLEGLGETWKLEAVEQAVKAKAKPKAKQEAESVQEKEEIEGK